MTGKEITLRVEEELVRQKISKAEFYAACGISSATFPSGGMVYMFHPHRR